jgi:NhaP-type Na+/H+ or K+/H+ antiporter
MVNRIAGILSLIAFAMVALVGSLEADNGFATTVSRALTAMLGTYVVGYLVGLAAERMRAENLTKTEERLSAERSAQLKEREAAAESAAVLAHGSATDGR